MSRDYAKKTPTRAKTAQKRRQPRQSKTKGRLFYGILLCLIGIGAYRYFAVDFSKLKQDVIHSIDIAQNKVKDVQQPVFEFYTRLPKGQEQPYNAPISSYHAPQQTNELKPSSTQVGHQYLIQVGSFKNFSDADKLRAALILQGYQVKLSRFINNAVTWHRVEVGPYLSLQQAKEQQQLLENQHHNGLIKQVS